MKFLKLVFKLNTYKFGVVAVSSLLNIFATTLHAQTDSIFKAPSRGFTSALPAEIWENSLITGNGTMGALVMGHPYNETVILSHAKLYIPLNEPKQLINQASRLPEIQALLLEGKYQEAAKIPTQQREIEGFNIGRDPFIPAFDIKIEQPKLSLKNYLRAVNYETGEASVNWTDTTGTYKRTVFVSRPDSVIVISIKGSGKINCTIRFSQRPIDAKQIQFVKQGIANTQTNIAFNIPSCNSSLGSIEGNSSRTGISTGSI